MLKRVDKSNGILSEGEKVEKHDRKESYVTRKTRGSESPERIVQKETDYVMR